MIYSASSETTSDVDEFVDAARICMERYLVIAIDNEVLRNLDIKLRYTPIVVNDEVRWRYPERSKAKAKERVYDCSPQLSHSIFLNGSWEQQLEEYSRGLSACLGELKKVGATEQHIAELRTIFTKVVPELLRLNPTQYDVKYDNGNPVIDLAERDRRIKNEQLLRMLLSTRKDNT